MSTPLDRIKQTYLDRPEAHPLEWYLHWHLEHGYVFCTPDFFVMGFPVNKHRLGNDEHPFDCYKPDGDCWYVFAMAGNMAKAWSIMPWPLPFIGWHRDRVGKPGGKDLQLVPLHRIQRLTKGYIP